VMAPPRTLPTQPGQRSDVFSENSVECVHWVQLLPGCQPPQMLPVLAASGRGKLSDAGSLVRRAGRLWDSRSDQVNGAGRDGVSQPPEPVALGHERGTQCKIDQGRDHLMPCGAVRQ
jgi:hypothetical protein